MVSSPKFLPLQLIAASVIILSGASSLYGATITWAGVTAGGPNSSGNWVDAPNWQGGVVPVPPANTSSDVSFQNVTSGSRTVSINNGETATAKTIQFAQTTAGASNILSIASGGTLNLNSAQTWNAATTGTARVDLGGTVNFSVYNSGTVTVNTALTFTNAGAGFGKSAGTASPATFNFGGAVNVNAGAGTAKIFELGTAAINSTFGSTSSLLINTGTLEFTSAVFSGSPGITVSLQGATTLASGTGLKLTTDSGNNAGGGSSGVTLTNSGTLSQAGTITTNGRGSGGASTLTNSNVWSVSGTGAIIEKTARATAANPTFVNSGTFKGSSSSDAIVFNHLQTPGTDLAFAQNSILAAGNGTGGSGLTSVGTLLLTNFAVTSGASSSFQFDLGGTTSGQYDVLTLTSGSLNLTLGGTLALTLVNGFTPGTGFSINLITGGSTVTGSFANLTINGSSNANYSFAFASGIGTLTYAVPEPATWGLLAFSLTTVAVMRRRRKA